MHRLRLVVVLESRVHVHQLSTLTELRVIDTPANGRALAALTSCSSPCLLALPAASDSGLVRVHDLAHDGGHVLCELPAHRAPLATMAWSADGSMLATASQTGTVVRVWALPGVGRAAFSFRRGTVPAPLHCLSFSPPGYWPPLLAAASGHGTMHLFRLAHAPRSPVAAAAAAAAGLLAAVAAPRVSDMVRAHTGCWTAAACNMLCALHTAHCACSIFQSNSVK